MHRVETCNPIRFHKDNKRVYIISNKGDVDLVRLVLLDPETSKEEMVESDPMKREVDLSGAASDLTDELILTSYQDEKPRLYFKDKAVEADYKLVKQKMGGKVSFGGSTTDETKFIVWRGAIMNQVKHLFDRKTKG